MAYNDALKSLKQALENYSDEEKKISALYAKARGEQAARYAESLDAIDAERIKKRNSAAADAMAAERNLNNYIAARGLGFSGEAAQAKINSQISLNNRLGALDSENSAAKKALTSEYGDKLGEIDKAEIKSVSDINERRNSLLSDIAALERKEAQSAGLPDGKSDNGGSEPPYTAKELAKQIISAAGGEGKADPSEQNAKVKEILDGIKSRFALDESYLNDLEFALAASGYYDPGEGERKADSGSAIKDLIANAKAAIQSAYKRYSSMMKELGIDGKAAAEKAKEIAQKTEMALLYQNAESNSQFRKACVEIGIPQSRITEFIIKNTAKNKTR